MTMRRMAISACLLAPIGAFFVPAPAAAHWGHVGELAGHSHWIGLAAALAAAALAALAARKARGARDAAEDETDETTAIEPEEDAAPSREAT